MRRSAVAGMFALYGLIGAMQAIYGPLLPSFRAAFHATAAGAGLILSAHFCGAALGMLLAGPLGRQGSSSRLIGVATGLVAIGYLCLGVAPALPLALLATFCIGLGYGALVLAFTQLIVVHFGPRTAFMLLMLNADFGIGALAGPALVAFTAPGSFRSPFLIGSALAAALLPVAVTLSRLRPVTHTEQPSRAGQGRSDLLVRFIALLFLLGGIEASLGGWEATQLIAHGATASSAAILTALYWGTFTAGRLLVAPLTLRVSPQRLVLVALGAFILLATAALVAPLAPPAYTLAGLCLAPLYPLSLVWFDRVVLSARRAARWVMISDLVGGAIVPFLVGQLITVTSADSLAAALSGCGIVAFVIAASLHYPTASTP